MTCLETTFLIDLLRGEKSVSKLKDELDKTETHLSITAPSLMELWVGALLSKTSEKEKEKINSLVSSFTFLAMDEAASREAGEITFELLTTKELLDPIGIMIAGTARSHGEKLVTRDHHYARIQGLRLLKY